MLDYLFKGLVTVNRNVDNSTHKGQRSTHSYDTTFLVIWVLIVTICFILKIMYDMLTQRAMRMALARAEYGTPMYKLSSHPLAPPP